MKKLFLFMLVSWSVLANANENTETNSINVTETSDSEEEYNNEHLVEGKFRKGFSSITEVGAIHIGGNTFFTISETWGIRVNPYLFVGQGMHLSVSDNKWKDLSATVDVRTNLLKKNVSPFLMLGLGINRTNKPIITNEDVLQMGNRFLLNAGAGVEFRLSPKAGITLNGGYKLIANQKSQNHGGFVKVGYVF